MSDQNFDDSIKKRLSEFRSGDSPQWTKLQKKWNAYNKRQHDKQFDTYVAGQMKGFNSKISSDWSLMQKRLKHVKALQRHIQSVKMLEAASMLVLLLIFIGFVDYSHWLAPDSKSNTDTFAEISLENEENLNLMSEKDEYQSTSTNELKSEQIKSSFSSNEKTKILKTSTNTSGYENAINSTIKSDDRQLANNLQTSLEHHFIVENPERTGVRNEGKEFSIVEETETNLSYTSYNSPEVSDLGISLLDYEREYVFIEKPEYSYPIIPYSPSKRSWIQFFSSFDNNFIFTPDDLDYNTRSRTTEMYGYSLGLLYSTKLNKFEYEFGLGYSSFDKPWNFSLQYGNSSGWYSFVMTNIHYNILTMPMHLKKHLVENADWSIYGVAGISNEFILSSEYEKSSSYLGGGSVPIGTEVDPPLDGLSPFEEERNFTKGLLEGGSLNDAYFMRVAFGAGIQRNITESVSICFSGIYYRSLINQSLGPNNDRLDKMSINFSIKKQI